MAAPTTTTTVHEPISAEEKALFYEKIYTSVVNSIKNVGHENTMKIIHEVFTKIECISPCTLEEFKQGKFEIREPTMERAEMLFKEYFEKLDSQK